MMVWWMRDLRHEREVEVEVEVEVEARSRRSWISHIQKGFLETGRGPEISGRGSTGLYIRRKQPQVVQ